MSIFNLFNKKKEQLSNSENALEAALRRAADEVAYRPEFYKRILSEDLVVLTAPDQLPEGEQVLKESTNVRIASFADGKIPVFTSPEKIFDKGIVKEKMPYLAINGEELMKMTQGATLVLNPYSDYGKELLPAEVESLLDGTILSNSHQKMKVKEETTVQIGQPANYPTEIIDSLKLLFATKPEVKKAYMAWIYDPSSEDPPHYIFALEVDGDPQAITNEAGFTVKQHLKQEDIVDFIQIENGGLSDYFVNQTEPFYVG